MSGDIPTPTTTVVNIRRTKVYDVYIGRPSPAGNPFRIGPDGTREEVLAQFKVYFDRRMQRDLTFKAYIYTLTGKVLGCYCKELGCHGDIIAEYLNKKAEGKGGLNGHTTNK